MAVLNPPWFYLLSSDQIIHEVFRTIPAPWPAGESSPDGNSAGNEGEGDVLTV